MLTSHIHQINVDEVIALTRELVRFNTVNPPGNEEAAIRYLGDYLLGMPFVVEDDESLDPLHIGFFGTDRIVFAAGNVPYLIQKFLRSPGTSSQQILDIWTDNVVSFFPAHRGRNHVRQYRRNEHIAEAQR